MTKTATAPQWKLSTRVAFRFVFVYLVLYTVYAPIHFLAVPPIPQLFAKYVSLWQMVAGWVGRHLLGVAPNIPADISMPAASTDTTYHYVVVLCYLVFAAVATVVWSVLDHKRPNYERLNNWFRLYLRFSVGAIIIHYGAMKLVPRQFPPPMLAAMIENYGDMSPMGLLWNCIGISPLYGFFGGVGEVLGGTLLIIPQTALLGALISMAVMGNVLALNLGYDVTVKLMSVHLVGICGLLLLPDLKRLADLFVFNRRVDRPKPRPLFGNPRWNRVAVIAQIAVSLLLVGFYLNLHEHVVMRANREKSIPLRGIWSVEEFAQDGQVHPPLLTDKVRWQRLVIDSTRYAAVQLMDSEPPYYPLQLDSAARTMTIGSSKFRYDQPLPDVLTLQGESAGHQLQIRLRREDSSHFLLTTRGFHWINEYPVNY